MKRSEIKIAVKLGDVLDAGSWEIMCEKYGINEWSLNEGGDRDDTVDRNTKIKISLYEK